MAGRQIVVVAVVAVAVLAVCLVVTMQGVQTGPTELDQTVTYLPAGEQLLPVVNRPAQAYIVHTAESSLPMAGYDVAMGADMIGNAKNGVKIKSDGKGKTTVSWKAPANKRAAEIDALAKKVRQVQKTVAEAQRALKVELRDRKKAAFRRAFTSRRQRRRGRGRRGRRGHALVNVVYVQAPHRFARIPRPKNVPRVVNRLRDIFKTRNIRVARAPRPRPAPRPRARAPRRPKKVHKKKKKIKKKECKPYHLCGPMSVVAPRPGGGSASVSNPAGDNYVISGNTQTVQWVGGGPKAKVSLQLMFAYKMVKVLQKPKTNRGRFSWRVPHKLPNGSRYRIRIVSKNPGSNMIGDRKGTQVRYSGWFTIEKATGWGHNGRRRYWRSGGGGDEKEDGGIIGEGWKDGEGPYSMSSSSAAGEKSQKA